MVLAVCARDVKFYKWPSIDFLGAYEAPAECMSVKHISWCCDGKNVLVIKSKGEPLIAQAPIKMESRITTKRCVSLSNVSTGAFSKTALNLVSLGLENGEVCSINLDTKDIIRCKRLPSGVQNMDYSYNCQNILAGCFDGNIYLYDEKGKPAASFVIPNSYALSTTVFSNYANILGAGSKDGILAIWDAETADMLFTCKEHKARVTDIAFLENTVTSISTDGYLCLFDLRTHESVSKCNLEGALSSLAYFAGTYSLAVGTYNQLRDYDVRNLKNPVRTLLINNGGYIKKIAASPMNLKDVQQLSEKVCSKKQHRQDLSASGDFSVSSTIPSEITPTISEANYEDYSTAARSTKPIQMPSSSQAPDKCVKIYKASDVNQLEKFVGDYMKYSATQFAEKMAQDFYALRISTSKQFICMGEKMDQSWNNFISYLRYAGASERSSSTDSKPGSEKGEHKE